MGGMVANRRIMRYAPRAEAIKRWIPQGFLLAVFACLLTGCYVGAQQRVSVTVAAVNATVLPTPTDTPTPPPTLTPVPTLVLPPVPELPPNINPLTGLPADPAALQRRPIIAKISNAPSLVRPQAGIGSADVVYEHYVEGGLTRLSAVFYGELPERVGSIRSGRLIDLELVPMYGGLFAYSGASTGVEALLQASGFYPRAYMGVAYDAPYYWRDETIDAPHNMFMNARALSTLATQQSINDRPDLRGLTFDANPPPSASGRALYADVRYRAARAEWYYDPLERVYRRFSDGLVHTDANTGAGITADNVIILYAVHRETDIVESVWQGENLYSIEIALNGQGDAIVLRDGQQYRARWARPAAGNLLRYLTPDGLPLALKPGRTWVQVLPLPEHQDARYEGVSIQ